MCTSATATAPTSRWRCRPPITYAGETRIERGLLRADDGVGLPTNSLLRFSQNNADQTCILETHGTFERNIGQGAGEVYWDNIGGGGGFAARGGDLAVTLEGGDTLPWNGATNGLNSVHALQFGSRSADGMVELKNNIELDSSNVRNIAVVDNPDTKADVVRLSGVISGGNADTGKRFSFWDNGGNQFWPGDRYYSSLVELTASNTYITATAIRYCTLAADDGVGLPTNSCLRFWGHHDWRPAVLLTSGTFDRDIGSAQGEVLWNARGGFAARGGKLEVNLEGGIPLDWSDANTGLNNQVLQLGSQHADSVVEIRNDIMLDSTYDRCINLFDNLDTKADYAVLSGNLTTQDNPGRFLWIRGNGLLVMTGTNSTYEQHTIVDDGVTLRVPDQSIISANTTIAFDGNNRTWPCILETKGMLALNIGPQTEDGAVSWDRVHGGFAAHDGPLTVNLESGVEMDAASVDTGFEGHWQQYGSPTANDVVEFQNDIYLNNTAHYIQVFDNPDSEDDRSIYSGNIRIATWGDLSVYGEAPLEMTGSNTLRNMWVFENATVLINGEHDGQGEIATQANQSGTIGGNGTVTVANRFDIRQGCTLAPGAGEGEAGTLSVTVYGTDGLRLYDRSTYEWELGARGSDRVDVVGKLALFAGWTLKLLGAGGTPRPAAEYDIFTYTGAIAYNAPIVDTGEMPADWSTNGMTVVHDDVGKRVYITGLSSPLGIDNAAASSLTDTSAQLNGWLSNSGQVMDAWIYWGELDGGTNVASWSNSYYVGSFSNAIGAPLAHTATGLTVNTAYSYAFRATNATHDVWAAPAASFATLGPPAVANSAATGIRTPEATLNGRFLDHNRGDVTIYWGRSDGGTNAGDWDFSVSIGNQSNATFAAEVTGTLFPLTHYYRCYATNVYGEDWADSSASFVATKPLPPGPPVTDGLLGHWDAGVGVVTNGAGVVQTWNDLSGNGHHATLQSGTPTLVPDAISSLPEVQTRNQDSYFDVAGNMWVKEQYVVGRSAGAAWNNYGAFLANKNGRPGSYLFQNANKGFHSNQYPASASRDGTPLAVNATCLDPIDQYMVLKVVVNDGNKLPRTYWLGRSDHSVADLDIAEIVAYGNTLTPAQEDLVGGYLAAKYGIVTAYSPFDADSGLAVTNEHPTAVTTVSATLNATLNITSSVYDVWVYWGPADGTNNPTAWATNAFLGTLTNYVGAVSHPASIATGVTNYYTFRVTNALDDMWAAPSMDVPPVVPPAVNNAAGAIADTGSATLQGELTAGGAGDVSIFWGRSDGGTNAAVWDSAITMTDMREGAFDADVAAGHGVTYYYRCYVTNAAGAAWATFTTNFTTLEPELGTPGFPVTNGLLYHLDAALGVTKDASDNVSIWADTGAAGNDFSQGTAARQPLWLADSINNLPAIQFDGSDEELLLSTSTSPETFVAVTRVLTGGGLRGIWGHENADRGIRLSDNNWYQSFGHGGNNADFCGAVDGYAMVNGATTAGYTVGEPHIIAERKQSGLTGWPFGTTSIGEYYASRDYHGDVAELVTFDRALTVDELNQIGSYLSRKYGLTTAYPAWYTLGFTNSPIANVSTASVTMNGGLTADGWTFDIYACWGTNDGGTVIGNWESAVMVGSATNHTGPLTYGVAGLDRGTDYFCTFIATNAVTNLPATPSVAFQTMDVPTVTNLPPTDVTTTSARLNGSFVGGVGEATIYWGLADGGESHKAWQNTNALGAVLAGPLSADVSLLAGGQYVYRCYVTNALADDWADTTETFTSVLAGISIADVSVTEGHTGRVDMAFDVVLSDLCASNVTVDFASANGSAVGGTDYAATNGTLVIPAGQPGGQIVVRVYGDRTGEHPSEAFTMNLSGAVNATVTDDTAIGTIHDDDYDVWLEAWKGKMKITFAGYAGGETLTNFPALVVLGGDIPDFEYDHFASPHGLDLRFSDATRTEELNYEIEQWDTSGDSFVWVQVPELVDSNTCIWAYWSNEDATNAPAYTTNGATWSQDYLAVWHLNGTDASGMHPDSSGNGRDATDSGAGGGPTDVPAAIAGGQEFDGVDDYCNSGESFLNHGYLGPNSDFTIHVWVYPHTVAGTRRGYVGQNDRVEFGANPEPEGWSANTVSGTQITANEWKHIVFAADKSVMDLYQDGAFDATAGGAVYADSGGGNTVKIGGGGIWDAGGNWFDGVIDEARISKVKRSADWIAAAYANQAPGSAFAKYSDVSAPHGMLLIIR